jgi:methionyl-tRNA formyltransferase
MRIIVNGQQAFGKAVLDALLERGEDVVAVYCAPEKEGARADPLREAAEEMGLPLFQPPSYKKTEVWDQLRALKPDLSVMAFVTLFIPEEFLNMPTHGTIQYHPSLLPLHRGPSSINWPIIQGSKKTGLSIFWPNNGLDTGPILLQKEVEITGDDTLGTVYFDKLFQLGVDAMLEGVDLVKAGNAPKIVQDETNATYESWCKKEDAEIDWSKPVQDVYNLIRGTNPAPGAWTTHAGKTLQIFDSARLDDASGAPGEVVEVSADGVAVAAEGGGILVKRVRAEGGKKIPAREFADESGLAKGERLG